MSAAPPRRFDIALTNGQVDTWGYWTCRDGRAVRGDLARTTYVRADVADRLAKALRQVRMHWDEGEAVHADSTSEFGEPSVGDMVTVALAAYEDAR